MNYQATVNEGLANGQNYDWLFGKEQLFKKGLKLKSMDASS